MEFRIEAAWHFLANRIAGAVRVVRQSAVSPGLRVAVAAGLVLVAAPASANRCEVNPHEAWSIARDRGWQFSCSGGEFPPGAVISRQFVTEPAQGRIGCRWQTGPVSAPIVTGWMVFFRRENTPMMTRGELLRGWRIDGVEMSGGSWHDETHSGGPNSNRVRFVATVPLRQTGRTYTYRITRLWLHRPNGNCAVALDEAF